MTRAVRTIAVDALQVARALTGVGRQALAIGSELWELPDGIALELRCARDARATLAPAFPPGTRVRSPIPSSRPRIRRVAAQQLLGPLQDERSTLVVSLGEQAPLWGRTRVLAVVNDVRRLVAPGAEGRLESAYYGLLVRRAARRADVLVTISEFTRSELERLTGRYAIVVAHHPPPRATVPAATPGDGHLLVVGALRPYKGLETAIDALAALDPLRRPRLVLVGPTEGRDAALARRAAARGVADSVSIRGWVEEDELERLYAGALATVSPSTYEGYGLPVAESLARGVPAAASAIPPHREIGGADGVLYFEPGNAESLAEALRALEDPSLRRALAARGLERSRVLGAGRPTWRDVVLGAAGLS